MSNELKLAMEQFKAASCQFIYINGSFVTEKLNPGDFDACWDANGVDINYLESLESRLLPITKEELLSKTKNLTTP